jgi:hypothetical protein
MKFKSYKEGTESIQDWSRLISGFRLISSRLITGFYCIIIINLCVCNRCVPMKRLRDLLAPTLQSHTLLVSPLLLNLPHRLMTTSK